MEMGSISTNEIMDAFSQLDLGIYKMEDAERFLLSLENQKDNSKRLVAWLIYLGKLNPGPENYVPEISCLYSEYVNLRKRLLGNTINQPLSILSKSHSNLIAADILRSVSWFQSMAKEIGIESFYSMDASLHAHRVLTILSLYKKQFSYTQGFDRFVFVFYMLGLSFCQRTGLSVDFGEACAFQLATAMIPLVGVSCLLDDIVYSKNHFSKIDQRMEKLVPETWLWVNRINLGSFHFALRWELLLFADEHDPINLLLIWDQIIARKSDFRTFLADLCLAHIIQVPPVQDATMVEKLQHFKAWDNQKLLKDAISMFNHDKFLKIAKEKRNRNISIILFVILIFLFFTYYFNKIF